VSALPASVCRTRRTASHPQMSRHHQQTQAATVASPCRPHAVCRLRRLCRPHRRPRRRAATATCARCIERLRLPWLVACPVGPLGGARCACPPARSIWRRLHVPRRAARRNRRLRPRRALCRRGATRRRVPRPLGLSASLIRSTACRACAVDAARHGAIGRCAVGCGSTATSGGSARGQVLPRVRGALHDGLAAVLRRLRLSEVSQAGRTCNY
jgi:hypothetical protein